MSDQDATSTGDLADQLLADLPAEEVPTGDVGSEADAEGGELLSDVTSGGADDGDEEVPEGDFGAEGEEVDDLEAFLSGDAEPAEAPNVELEVEKQVSSDKDAEIATLKERLAAAEARFAGYEGPSMPDPELLNPDSDKYDPEGYNRQVFERKQFEAKQAEVLQKMEAERAQEIQRFSVQRNAELQETNPELFDPVKGPKLGAAIVAMAREAGIDEAQMPFIPAKGIQLIVDAMKHRGGQMKLAKATAAKKDSKTARRSMRKAPSKGDASANRFQKTGRVDDLASALLDESNA